MTDYLAVYEVELEETTVRDHIVCPVEEDGLDLLDIEVIIEEYIKETEGYDNVTVTDIQPITKQTDINNILEGVFDA